MLASLFGAVLLVLVIACVNTAQLVLAHQQVFTFLFDSLALEIVGSLSR